MELNIKDSIERHKRSTSGIQVKRLLLCAVICLPPLGYMFFPTVPVIKKEELRISSVKQGELKIEVAGYGKLRS